MTPLASPSLEVPQEQVAALQTDIQAQLAQLPTVITDQATYSKAKESLPVLKRAEDRVIGFFRDMKAAANRAHKAVTMAEAQQLTPISHARQRLSGLIYGFEREQERQRLDRERIAREEAQREAERQALEEADQLADQGAPAMAEQVIEQAIAAPMPVVSVPSVAVEVSGVSIRENWVPVFVGASPGQSWKDLTDDQRKRVMALLPREFCIPDESAIRRVVKAMKSSTKIPGVQAYDAGTVAVRG